MDKHIVFFNPGEKSAEKQIYTDDELKQYIDFSDFAGIFRQSEMAYDIAWELKRRGVTVVIGGIDHFAEEVLDFFDALAIGNSDDLWPRILKDFQDGNLKAIYEDSSHGLSATA